MKQVNKFLKNTLLVLSVIFIIAVLALLAGSRSRLTAQNTDVCFACHEDMDLTAEINGKKISLYVKPDTYKKSVHGSAECVDCHAGYNPDEVPHTKTKHNVDCKSCHDDQNINNLSASVHNKVNCYDCHTKHEVIPAKEYSKVQTENCIKCHNKKSIQSYKTSIHAKKNVGCESCHQSGHNTKKINKSEVADICGKCHGTHEKNFNNSIHQTVLKTGNKNAPTCTDCHGSHEILTNKMSIESQSCLKCHLNENLFPGQGKGSAKFVSEYKTSIHASIEKNGQEAAGCSDCHGNHMIQNPDNPSASTTRTRMPETCGKCHKDIEDKFYSSAHGKSLLSKNVAAPTCADCHNEHSIKAVKQADELSKINQVELCLNCHVNQKLPHKNYKGEEVLISNYKDSYHYKALKDGKLNAATCSDCHGAHEMNKFDDLNSKIYRKNIANTCGQPNCHVKQLSEYRGSIHEVSLMTKDNSDAPTCTNCHGNHQILKKTEQGNIISNPKGLVNLCSSCHNSVAMVKKYDLPAGRTQTYMSSYHGLAIRGGSTVAANCESCHGNHNIRPSTDSLSTISKKNLPETCGKCHPGAAATLLNSPIHNIKPEEVSPWLFWVSRFYILMIVVVIGGMVAHNIIDFSKKFRKKK